MKNLYILIGSLLISTSSFSQVNTTMLDENNIGGTLSDGGVFFSKIIDISPNSPNFYNSGMEFPKGSGKFAMEGFSMWFAGTNHFEEPRVSAPKRQGYNQQFIGPLSSSGEGAALPYNDVWSTGIFEISKDEIDYHIANYAAQGYTMPANIENWPAHGRVDLGFDYHIAPFVDINGDGNYNPENGDFPCIKGDQATYIITNDKEPHSDCGGIGNSSHLGLEIHSMFYQYSSIAELANITFCKVRVINKTTTPYTNFKSSMFMRGLIGQNVDDNCGTNVQRNLIYTYNADANDDFIYESFPPAVGIVSLNHPISRSRLLNDGPNYNYQSPTYPPEFWNVMNGNLLNGSPHSDQFAYSGNPYLGTGDLGPNQPGIHELFYTIDVGDLNWNDEVEFDFAIVTSVGLDHLQSVEELFNDVDYVQAFYNGDSELCHQEILSTDEPTELTKFDVYPNPSNGKITLSVDNALIGGSYTIFDTKGRVIVSSQSIESEKTTITLTEEPGIYFLKLNANQSTGTNRIVIN
ncbi:MAG: hypothetical protein ACJASQ_001733 [Crocinitomicaceae bacterium]|jgi:hypothetical protein